MTSLCMCGCGGSAPIAQMTNTARGHRKGQPLRYIANHQPRPGGPPMTPEKALRQYVVPGEPAECWLWRGTRSQSGYGVVVLRQRQHRAHRVAYEAAYGPIPEGLIVRHACDNPPCVNPAHLSVGTGQDNSDDKVTRGRQPLGERAYQARLTEKDVLELRARRSNGESIAALAREFGVAEATAGGAIRGHSWKHVRRGVA